jgi:hypothetical protein
MNGEKTNPVPMELTLKGESPYISDAVIFGAGRTQVGALIVPSELASKANRVDFLSLIRPAIDRANEEAPSHSRLNLEALIILPPDAPIPCADKGSFIRQKTYKLYQREIEELYANLAGAGNPANSVHPNRTLVLTEEEALYAVRHIVHRLLQSDRDDSRLSDDQDLFEAGVDSIQGTRIRDALQRVSHSICSYGAW